MDKLLVPEYNAKEKEHQDSYSRLLARLKFNSIGGKQTFRCVYERVHENINGFKQDLKMKESLIFSIEAKFVCKSCNNFRFYPEHSVFRCKCGKYAQLCTTITNLGAPNNVEVAVSLEKNDSQLTQIFNITKDWQKNINYQENWCFYFTSAGNLTFVCDIKGMKQENGFSTKATELPGTFTMLAEQFSDANINPPVPLVDQLTDIVLIVGENKIHCHKLVLGMTSKFFRRMFVSNMKESKAQEIELKEIDLETIKSVLSFMYTDKIDAEKINVALLAASDMYEVLRLKCLCCQKLSESINAQNVIEIWQTAYRHNVEDLAHEALVFMVANWEMLAMDDDIKELCRKHPDLSFTISTLLMER